MISYKVVIIMTNSIYENNIQIVMKLADRKRCRGIDYKIDIYISRVQYNIQTFI